MVEKSGFRPARVAHIPLSVGLTATVNVSLELGTVSEAIEVQATAVQLEAQTSGLGKTVETRRVIELPLLTRSPLGLSALAPGVVPSRSRGAIGDDLIGSATGSRISGGLAAHNAVLTDGGESRGTNSNGQAYAVPLESVAEFKVETANYSAEFGRAPGGIVQVATKSGTNEFHGSAYEFLRNDHLNANNWSNNRNRIPKGLFQRNEFGGSAGGRIIRNRTFFFANYEGTRQGSPVQFLSTVPTAQQKAGDFSQTLDRTGSQFQVYDPLTTRADTARPGSYIRELFPGDRIPSSRVHSISQKALPFWPAPNRTGEGVTQVNNFFLAGKNVRPTNALFGRIDHVINDRHRLFGRVGVTQARSFDSGLESIAFPARNIASTPGRSALISETSTFSPSILGELRISYTRLQTNSYPVSEGFDTAGLGFPDSFNRNVLYRQFPQISVQSYASGSGLSVTMAPPNEVGQLGGASKSLNPEDTWQGQYHFTVIRNRHKLKMGTDLQLLRLNVYNSQLSAGQFIFDRVYTQGPDPSRATLNGGHGLASFLLGVPITGALTFVPRLMLYQKYYGFYFQDDFRITNKLTLNLGLRYEYLTPYAEKYGQIGYLDLNATEPVTGAKGVFKFNEPGEYQSDPQKKNFGPRIGFAWQMSPKMVVRAAGAIFYAANNGLNPAASDFGNGTFVSNPLNLGPPNAAPFTPPVNGSWSNPFAGGFGYPTKDTTFAGQDVRTDVRDHPMAYIGNWNLSIQRMIRPTLMLETAYVGSKLTHSFWNRYRNANDPALLALGPRLLDPVPNPYFGKITSGALSFPTVQRRQLLRPFPQYQSVLIFRDPYGGGSYESMIVRVEQRYAARVHYFR